MKLINLLYRGGAGGEFFGGLLVEHEAMATQKLKYDENKERWFLKRNDWASQRPEVTRCEDPRKGIIHGRPPQNWSDKLWNVRLDHGYGFSLWTDFWIDYLWNEWKETRTIIFKSKTPESLEYTQKLSTLKLGFGPGDVDARAGEDMIVDGIFDVEQFWKRPWESDAYYFNMFMDMIPDDHDFLLIDPCELLHNNDLDTEESLKEIIDYLGIDNSLYDDWIEKIKTYRIKNKELINNTIV